MLETDRIVIARTSVANSKAGLGVQLSARHFGSRPSRFPNHKFRVHQDTGLMSVASFDAIDQRLGCQRADLAQRLADRRQAGQMVGRFANVVEADD